jgi:aspartyl-tRNA(Asn)/glutamyl-tRNA(Gln) amidotransferase subunit B
MSKEMDYIPTIGLEIHAELKTASKMFCGCKNAPHAENPNVHVCPVCMAHPGTLPVINKEAVLHVLRVGVALGGSPADFTEFDRKNYFYPDIPKNYQISQYKYPLILGGAIGETAITRIHLEEDTARSSHVGDKSLVDFNRAGVPLMELVTEPVIHSAEEVLVFAKELQLLLRHLKASDANLEKGEMRIEVNISIAKKTDENLGTKVEVKNLNSLKAAEQAVYYEIRRQKEVLERGEKVVQETRGWDEARQKTVSQRKKENSHDYRYFPDPDLPKLFLSEYSEFSKKHTYATLPELPWQIRARYHAQGMSATTSATLLNNESLRLAYEDCLSETSDDRLRELARNYLTSDILGWCIKKGGMLPSNFSARNFINLLLFAQKGNLSSRGVKDTLERWFCMECEGDTVQLAHSLSLVQISEEKVLEKVANDIIREYPDAVQSYKGGKETAIQFLVGQCMRASKGAGNPIVFADILKRIL